jgi:tRNA uridine 5-carbamoylmethylation protein Kti12
VGDKRVIAFSGWCGVGKTTLANKLAEKLSGEVLSFADLVRTQLALALDEDSNSLWERSAPRSTRDLLQTFAAFMREMHGEDYWCNKFNTALQTCDSSLVFVDDLRFKAELSCLRQYNSTVCFVGDSRDDYNLAFIEHYSDCYLPAKPSVKRALQALALKP